MYIPAPPVAPRASATDVSPQRPVDDRVVPGSVATAPTRGTSQENIRATGVFLFSVLG